MNVFEGKAVAGPDSEKKEFVSIYRSYLNVRDEKGAYRIYVGRESRRKLLTLFEKPGVVTRSLEIDLNTGTVYFDVAADNRSTEAYFYDSANRKVDNFEITQFLKFVKPPFRPSDLELEIFSRFPSENWLEDLRKIPGWPEIIDEHLNSLRLPKGDVTVTEVSEEELLSAGEETGLTVQENGEVKNLRWEALTGVRITLRSKVSRRGWHSCFTIENKGENVILHHRNDNAGAEFFHEDEEFERNLSSEEYAWVLGKVREMVDGEMLLEEEPEEQSEGTGKRAHRPVNMDSIQLEFGDSKFIWKPRTMHRARETEKLLMAFLRREQEICAAVGAGYKASGSISAQTGEMREATAEEEKKTEEKETKIPKIQARIGQMQMEEAVSLMIRLQKQVSAIEISPSFMIRYGLRGISKFKEQLPDKPLICDTNILRDAQAHAGQAFEAGADIVTVLAVAKEDEIAACINTAGKYNRRVMAKTAGIPEDRRDVTAKKLREMGVDLIDRIPDTEIVDAGENMIPEIVKILNRKDA